MASIKSFQYFTDRRQSLTNRIHSKSLGLFLLFSLVFFFPEIKTTLHTHTAARAKVNLLQETRAVETRRKKQLLLDEGSFGVTLLLFVNCTRCTTTSAGASFDGERGNFSA
jgi:hypothetical protein